MQKRLAVCEGRRRREGVKPHSHGAWWSRLWLNIDFPDIFRRHSSAWVVSASHTLALHTCLFTVLRQHRLPSSSRIWIIWFIHKSKRHFINSWTALVAFFFHTTISLFLATFRCYINPISSAVTSAFAAQGGPEFVTLFIHHSPSSSS